MRSKNDLKLLSYCVRGEGDKCVRLMADVRARRSRGAGLCGAVGGIRAHMLRFLYTRPCPPADVRSRPQHHMCGLAAFTLLMHVHLLNVVLISSG